MPPPEIELLVQILAQTDALFTPYRQPRDAAWAHIWLARWQYAKTGIAWRAGGNQTARKSVQRLLQRLRSAGLVQTFTAGGRTYGVRLTMQGQHVARSLADLYGLSDALRTLIRLHVLRDAPESSVPESSIDHVDSRPWLPEVSFTSPAGLGWGDGHSAELAEVMFQFAMPQSLGWAEYNSDVDGHVRFRLTPDGLAIVQLKTKAPTTPPDLPEPVEELANLYDVERQAAKREFWSKTERLAEIGPIALRSSFLTKGCAREIA